MFTPSVARDPAGLSARQHRRTAAAADTRSRYWYKQSIVYLVGTFDGIPASLRRSVCATGLSNKRSSKYKSIPMVPAFSLKKTRDTLFQISNKNKWICVHGSTDRAEHDLSAVDPNLLQYEILCGICTAVQIQPKNRVLDHAECTSPTLQHTDRYTAIDRSGISYVHMYWYESALKDLDKCE